MLDLSNNDGGALSMSKMGADHHVPFTGDPNQPRRPDGPETEATFVTLPLKAAVLSEDSHWLHFIELFHFIKAVTACISVSHGTKASKWK